MKISKITENKKQFLDLLLLADEQENMIDKYLDCGEMFILEDDGVKAECVVTKEGDGVYELKNLAVAPEAQRCGYGKKMVEFVLSYYPDWKEFLVGTGEAPCTLNFYKKCGFVESHRVENFFTENYDHELIDDGIVLKDMIYLSMKR